MNYFHTLAAIGVLSLMSTNVPAAGHASHMTGTPMATPSAARTTTTQSSTTTRSPAHTTGQPGQTCGSASAPTTPGNAAAAPGSAFNPDGQAGSVYAGQQTQNSGNTASVAQYDVACSHQPR